MSSNNFDVAYSYNTVTIKTGIKNIKFREADIIVCICRGIPLQIYILIRGHPCFICGFWMPLKGWKRSWAQKTIKERDGKMKKSTIIVCLALFVAFMGIVATAGGATDYPKKRMRDAKKSLFLCQEK